MQRCLIVIAFQLRPPVAGPAIAQPGGQHYAHEVPGIYGIKIPAVDPGRCSIGEDYAGRPTLRAPGRYNTRLPRPCIIQPGYYYGTRQRPVNKAAVG